MNRARRTVRRVLAAAVCVLLVGVVCASAFGSSTSPAPRIVSVDRYELDQHVDAGLTNPSGVVHAVPHMLAAIVWGIDRLTVSLLVSAFQLAFRLDLVDGRSGLLTSVSASVRTLNSGIAQPLLASAILLLGLYSTWKLLAQRRFVDGVTQIAASIGFCVVATAIVLAPAATIGTASQYANDLSDLMLTSTTPAHTAGDPTVAAVATLRTALIEQPWLLLDFGSSVQCTDHDGEPTTPRAYTDAGRPIARAGDTCLQAEHYADRFLSKEPGSDDRNDAYNDLRNGPPAERRLVEIQGADGGYRRVALALAVLLASVGAVLLVGALSLGMIATQLLALVLFALSPVALLASLLPGHGHLIFRRWLAALFGALFRKAIYSLYLGVLLGVATQLQAHSASLGPGVSWTIQIALWWGVLIWGRQLSQRLTGRDHTNLATARIVTRTIVQPITARSPKPSTLRPSGDAS